MEKEEFLEKVLKDLKNIGSIESVAIVSRDGLEIASTMDTEKSRALVAVSATLLGSAEHSFAEMSKGLPKRVIVESSNCKMVVVGAGPKALLLIIADPDISLGLILIKAEKAAEKIKEILE